jgi:hypothetical protein
VHLEKALVLAALGTLCACSGGNNGSGSVSVPAPTPTSTAPSPTPSPGPTSTPTPSPTYSSFPVTSGDVRGPTDFAVMRFRRLANGLEFMHSAVEFGEAVITSNRTGGQFILVAPGYLSSYFNASTLNNPNGPNGIEVQILEPGSFGGIARILNNFLPDQMVGDPAYQFRYLTYATLTASSPLVTDGSRDTYFHVGGYLTLPSDMPRSVRTYTTILRSTYYQADQTSEAPVATISSSGSIRYDPSSPSASRVTINMTLVLNRPNQQGVALASISGTGAVAADGSIRGTFSSSNSGFTGQFGGALYGPGGAEAGIALTLQSSTPQQQRIVGAVLGR